VRPATYESAAEAKVLSKWFSGRDGVLENTTFVLLDPSGEIALTRAGRGPEMVFAHALSFAAKLKQLGTTYKAKQGERTLPTVADFRLGLNVAASDGLPLIAIVGPSTAAREQMAKALAKTIWDKQFHGLAHYVVLEDRSALEKLNGYVADQSIYVLQPDTFARSGKIVSAFAASEEQLAPKLSAALSGARIEKASHRQHVRDGKRAGISWISKIPVTDGAASRNGRKR
jgi:hypothetical protein